MNVSLERLDPKKLSQDDYIRLYELLQDMWASGVDAPGEFAQCNSCHTVHSKGDIFGNQPKEIYMQVVSRIMEILAIDTILCPHCGGHTKLIYGPEYIEQLRHKFSTSVFAYLLVAKSQEEYVGCGSYYVNTPEYIFDMEFHPHYAEIGFDGFSDTINKQMGYVPEQLIIFSSLGFREGYKSLFQIFDTLKGAYTGIDANFAGFPGIMELDKKNILYFIFKQAGGIVLDIPKEKIRNTYSNYNSVIVVLPNAMETLQQICKGGVRSLLPRFTAFTDKLRIEYPSLDSSGVEKVASL